MIFRQRVLFRIRHIVRYRSTSKCYREAAQVSKIRCEHDKSSQAKRTRSSAKSQLNENVEEASETEAADEGELNSVLVGSAILQHNESSNKDEIVIKGYSQSKFSKITAISNDNAKEKREEPAGGVENHSDGSKKDYIFAVKKQLNFHLEDYVIQNIMSYPLHVPKQQIDDNNLLPENIKASLPSVTSILQETMSFESRKKLEIWKQNMINEMGAEKFNEIQKDPVKKSISKKLLKNKKIIVATLSRGNKFHHTLKQYLLGADINKLAICKEVEGCWNSVQNILGEVSDVKIVESNIFHPHLYYKGIVDCVASYKNVPHVIEWKQSEKVKKDLVSTFDAPVQLSAYMGALTWCKNMNLEEPVKNGLVVVAYIDGRPADAYEMNLDFCESYWEQWLRRVQQFWISRSQKLKSQAFT